jgi:hypothetical protein
MDGRALTAAFLTVLTVASAARGSRGVVRRGRDVARPPPEEPLHAVANPKICDPIEDLELYKIRIDDRGDLCVYVFSALGINSADDATEEAEAYARKHGWTFDEEDVTSVPMREDEEARVRDFVAWLNKV